MSDISFQAPATPKPDGMSIDVYSSLKSLAGVFNADGNTMNQQATAEVLAALLADEWLVETYEVNGSVIDNAIAGESNNGQEIARQVMARVNGHKEQLGYLHPRVA